MRILYPEPGDTDIDTELEGYSPFEHPHEKRPSVTLNMVTSLDGRASVKGRSKELGSKVDSELLLKLRTRFDAVMIGAGIFALTGQIAQLSGSQLVVRARRGVSLRQSGTIFLRPA